MQLDSVRSLKIELFEMWAERGLPGVEMGDQAHELPALGIAPTPWGDYRLAVGLQYSMPSSEIARLDELALGEIDVQHIGDVIPLARPWHRSRIRPIRIGCSIGHASGRIGSIGGFVRRSGERLELLSNNHVLANNDVQSLGDDVLQPAALDGGHAPSDRVGSVAALVPLSQDINFVDCATSTLAEDALVDTSILEGVGRLKGIASGHMQDVEKIGRTTGHTVGQITAFELDNVNVKFSETRRLRFNEQIEIVGRRRSFSDSGDSGSLVFSSVEHLAVGLLFAGSVRGNSVGTGHSFANPIARVLTSLGATLES